MRSRPLHDDEYTKLVLLLRLIRKEAGVTQAELASRIGVDQSLVSKVERQERRLDVAELRRTCMALGLSLAQFVTRFEESLAAQTPSSLQRNEDPS